MYVSHYCSSNHPSFSSTLLDSIYRSFDLGEEGMGIYRQPIIDKIRIPSDEEIANFQRVCMIEKLMMDKNNKVTVPRRKLAEPTKQGGSFGFSFSSSSDSSSGGGEPEEISFPGAPLRRPKPIRTGGSGHHHKEKTRENHHRLDFETNRRERIRGLADEPKPKHEGGFLKTKSKALKIYADLKKVKQPISPGRKLATFLNSLFTAAAGNSKKHKSDSNNRHHSPPAASKSANTSTCSSASSFSRSCLSKPPSSSSGKFPISAKRSVKFFPGSVIGDEDCQPCERKALSLHQETKPMNATVYSELLKNKNVKSSIDEELKVHVMEYNRRVEDAAMDFLRKTHFKNRVFDEESEEEDEEDEDMESCASSDLFELDNLSTIGVVERYRKELPVYETTDAKRVV
ncbi:protein BIG GRAIN 1-like B [Henckelia pumila]|uniref:protein BIG GRAIN 1-like B n=1 Tax=Henckelia pumila TaxID=405737 RepID=UPI003C6E29CE